MVEITNKLENETTTDDNTDEQIQKIIDGKLKN